jgi:hypothetical protein
MARRVTPKAYKEQQAQSSNGKNFPKLSEILVNLSVKNLPVNGEKTVRLRLIGDPISFKEYNDKKWVPNPNRDPELKGKSEKVPFPDAHLTKSLTRIGHDDEDQCPWKALGYIGSTKYAQNVLEYDAETKTWVPKILCKGSSIFDDIVAWQTGRIEEKNDLISQGEEEEAETLVTHLGTSNSPCVRIKAIKKGEMTNQVEYEVTFESKNTKLTDEMIELLRAAGEPSAEQMAKERAIYEEDREADPALPEWEDVFAYGYDLMKIFKHTPIKQDAAAAAAPEETTPASSLDMSSAENDDDAEEETPAPAPKSKAGKAKAAAAPEPESNPFDGEDEDEDIGWAN